MGAGPNYRTDNRAKAEARLNQSNELLPTAAAHYYLGLRIRFGK